MAQRELLWTQLLSKLRPQQLLKRYSKIAAGQGFDRLYVLFSFDCDTERDIEVAGEVHGRLQRMGITAAYAVPGALLETGADVYRRIHATGAEFINHGYAAHSVYHAETKTYESTLFYDRISSEAVVEDIKQGHEALAGVLGGAPSGFRAPHFGTFQEQPQLDLLYETLASLGYRYSSSTVPRAGLRRGPAFEVRPGLWEIPVTGCYDNPLRILDSWGFRFAPAAGTAGSDEYREQFEKMLEFFSGRPGILNYYADPSQVHDWEDFFVCMRKAAPFALGSYTGLVDAVEAARSAG